MNINESGYDYYQCRECNIVYKVPRGSSAPSDDIGLNNDPKKCSHVYSVFDYNDNGHYAFCCYCGSSDGKGLHKHTFVSGHCACGAREKR